MTKSKTFSGLAFGADPEAFLINKETKKITSAIGLIPGSKYEPFLIGENQFEAIQTDNVMIEFCQEPTVDPVKFYTDSNKILDFVRSILPSNLDISIQASAELDESELDNEQAKQFGCDPDYNAWTGKKNKAPNANTNLRTAGGHLHIGYDDSNPELNLEIIKVLDLYLTVPSLLIDKDDRRREMYGKAGAYRHKDYGVELRTLSNFWIGSQETVKWVFENAQEALSVLELSELKVNNFLDTGSMAEIQLAINTNDKSLAKQLCDFYKVNYSLNTVKLEK